MTRIKRNICKHYVWFNLPQSLSFLQSARLSYTIGHLHGFEIYHHHRDTWMWERHHNILLLCGMPRFLTLSRHRSPPRSPPNSTVSPTRITIIIASQPVPEIWNLPLSSSLTLRYRIDRSIGSWMLDNVQYLGASPSHHLTYVMPHSCQRHHGLHCVVTSSRRHASYYLVCIQRDGWVT